MHGANCRMAETEQARRQQLMKNGIHTRMRITVQSNKHTVPLLHSAAPPKERNALPLCGLPRVGVLSAAGACASAWCLAPSSGLATAAAWQRLKTTITAISVSGTACHYICLSELLLIKCLS